MIFRTDLLPPDLYFFSFLKQIIFFHVVILSRKLILTGIHVHFTKCECWSYENPLYAINIDV